MREAADAAPRRAELAAGHGPYGTAFDIAGKGLADALSMVNSIKVAAALARREGLIEV